MTVQVATTNQVSLILANQAAFSNIQKYWGLLDAA
jgi:hypothetical protein